MRSTKLFLIACILSSLISPVAFACRFNVRDVGFVDLGTQPYGLFCYIDAGTDQEVTDIFRELANVELAETNILARTIDVDATPDHPVLKYLPQDKRTYPAFVLISPDREAMTIDSIEKGQGFKGSLQKAFKNIVSSPIRKELIEKTINVFGVVLVIEGPGAEENKKAITAAQTAIEQVTAQMATLPKLIEKPPVLMVLSRQQYAQEKMFLWSMGVDAGNITQTYAAIFYGRSRRMGSILSGKHLTKEMIGKFLFVIGADCECGLDRSWMQGTMPPIQWDKQTQALIASKLKFDPENPMIKQEMRQILRKGDGSRRRGESNKTPSLDDLAVLNMGYHEIVIAFDNTPPVISPGYEKPEQPQAKTDDTNIEAAAPKQTPPAPQEITPPTEPKTLGTAFQKPIYIIIALAVLIVIIGSFVMLRSSGDKQ